MRTQPVSSTTAALMALRQLHPPAEAPPVELEPEAPEEHADPNTALEALIRLL